MSLWHCWLGHLTRKNPSPIWPIMCLVGRKPYSISQSIATNKCMKVGQQRTMSAPLGYSSRISFNVICVFFKWIKLLLRCCLFLPGCSRLAFTRDRSSGLVGHFRGTRRVTVWRRCRILRSMSQMSCQCISTDNLTARFDQILSQYDNWWFNGFNEMSYV